MPDKITNQLCGVSKQKSFIELQPSIERIFSGNYFDKWIFIYVNLKSKVPNM